MKPIATQKDQQIQMLQYAETIPIRTGGFDKFMLKGSQFQPPLLEFSGACSGCGETSYLKLITQLFGDRMIIANATGCSSIWGGSAPSVPFTTNTKGHGPAWANSLFEDNAEYGFGMVLATSQRRAKLADLITQATQKTPGELKDAFTGWVQNMYDVEKSREFGEKIKTFLEKNHSDELLNQIWESRDMLTKKSIWAVGGDGWAYDIGYGGLDHVLAMNEDINILVLDTELYSNTGGQSSKATPVGSIAKFAESGKKTKKKDLGLIAMSYGYVYVASVAMGANKNQLLKALREAESYHGPSLIIAYAPCINHGIKAGMGKSQEEEKRAVESGYWPLYRYDPRLGAEGKNPFQLDYQPPNGTIHEFLMGEVRYAALVQSFPEEAAKLHKQLEDSAASRYKAYKNMAEQKT
jgi:pyruvate-ferredoxin/flavodoxin oxidoreductase